MKKAIVLVMFALFLASCSGTLKQSEFLEHDTMYKNMDHLKFSWFGYRNATEEDRQRGLMFRGTLREDQGMLFVFGTESLHAFWMKNTYLSLDIFFLSAEGLIVDIYRGLPPCPMSPCPRYTARSPATYALEVNAGFAERYEIQKGDLVRLELTE